MAVRRLENKNKIHSSNVAAFVFGIVFTLLLNNILPKHGALTIIMSETTTNTVPGLRAPQHEVVLDNSKSSESRSLEDEQPSKEEDETSSSSSSSSWPGQPSYELKSPQETKLVRIGQHLGPVDNVREWILSKAPLEKSSHLEDFLKVYKNRPDKTNTCGIRINHSLAIYTIAKRLQPTTIIESGVNSGQSTYFFRQAAPNAKIISIDPLEKPICGQPIRWIDKTNNEYLTGKENFIDFDAVDWGKRIASGEIKPDSTLVFVDDHMGFFKRFPTLVKYGFRHVMNEDNYQANEGATKWDKAGLTPKQMFRNVKDANTIWLFHNLKSYAEFPPLLPPILSKNTTVPKKKAGGFLHHTDDLRPIEEPILRPELSKEDNDLFIKVGKELGFDISMVESEDYQEFMAYCFIAYMEVVPLAPHLSTAWKI